MKSICVFGPGRVRVIDKPSPVRAPGEALLRVKYSGICGSDLQLLTGHQPFATYPRVPGHEFCAEVVEIEDSVDGPRVGSLVVGVPYFNCKTCYPCRRGLVNCCVNNQTMGVHRDGSFDEYITMPVEYLYSAQGVMPEQAAMVEPFSIGYHAINRVEQIDGQNVLVLGAGAIGLFTSISANLKGARVYVADVLPERLEVARVLGAAGAFDLRMTTIDEVVARATGGDGFDLVAEATGVPSSFVNAIEAVTHGGSIVLIGNGSRETTFNHSILIKKEAKVYGARNSLQAFPDILQLLRDNIVNIAPILTGIKAAAEGDHVMEALQENPASHLKVLLKF